MYRLGLDGAWKGLFSTPAGYNSFINSPCRPGCLPHSRPCAGRGDTVSGAMRVGDREPGAESDPSVLCASKRVMREKVVQGQRTLPGEGGNRRGEFELYLRSFTGVPYVAPSIRCVPS